MADDYVIYDYDNEEALTFSDMDGLREYAKNKLDARGNQCDDFAIMAYMAEIGKPFTWKGHKFVVWDDEFEGWHQYHASTKKSQSQPKSFSDMVNKQRERNVKKGIYYGYFEDGTEVEGELPEPMSKDEAEGYCWKVIGPYTHPEVVHAIFSLIADGDIEKYKELYIEHFKNRW